jgi:hypothetical protein
MNESQIRDLIRQLGESPDFQRILEAAGITPLEAARELSRPIGRLERKAIRRLARISTELLSQRGAGSALDRLRALINQDIKPELQMRAAIAILGIGGFRAAGRRTASPAPKKPPAQNPPTPDDSAETREILALAAQIIEERRRIAAMGEPPPAPPSPAPRNPAPTPA